MVCVLAVAALVVSIGAWVVLLSVAFCGSDAPAPSYARLSGGASLARAKTYCSLPVLTTNSDASTPFANFCRESCEQA